jgi:hypothetical protein
MPTITPVTALILILATTLNGYADTLDSKKTLQGKPTVEMTSSPRRLIRIRLTEFLIQADNPLVVSKAPDVERFASLNAMAQSGRAEAIRSEILTSPGTTTVSKSVTRLIYPESYGGTKNRPVSQDFIAREVGLSVEVTATAGEDSSTVDLSLHTIRFGMDAKPGAKKDATGFPSKPIFSSSSLPEKITVKVDAPTCVSVVSAEQTNKDKRTRLNFITAEIETF